MAGQWPGDGEYSQSYRPPVNPRPHVRAQAGGVRPPVRRPVPPPRGPGGPDDPAGQRPAPQRRRKRRAGRIFGVVLLLIVLALAAGWFYVDSSLNRVAAISDYPGRPAAGEGTNWLIVGSDSRAGLTAEQAAKLHTGDEAAASGKRTDTIMLVHLPDNDAKPTMVSLLRDSFVDIPGHGKSKINAAFAWGGPPLLVKTVEKATGLRIDHYAEIGFGGFASVVDDVGGVKVCLKQPVRDSYSGIDLPAGCQELKGSTALGYVRSRHAFDAGDYARTEHQREFIGALASKISGPGVLLNPFRVFPLLTDLPQALTVDDGDHLQNLIALGWDVRGISDGGVVTTAVPIGGNSGSDLLWDESGAQQMFHALNHDRPVPKELIGIR